MLADATVALVAATCASISVAPFLMCVDRGVVAAAVATPWADPSAPSAPAAGEFVTKPKVAFGQPAVWIVAAVYGGTYFAKNFADVLIERRGLSESRAAGTAKFCATTATNMGGSIPKDAASRDGSAPPPPPPPRLPSSQRPPTPSSPRAIASPSAARSSSPTPMRARRSPRAGVAGNCRGVVSQLVSPPPCKSSARPYLALNLVNVPAASAAARASPRSGRPTPTASRTRCARTSWVYGVGWIAQRRWTARPSGRRRWRVSWSAQTSRDTRWVRFGAKKFYKKISAAGAGVSEREVSVGGGERGGCEFAARALLPVATRAAQVREHHERHGGCGGFQSKRRFRSRRWRTRAPGVGNGRGAMGGAETWVSAKEVVGGGAGVAQNICAPWARWADARRANGAGG